MPIKSNRETEKYYFEMFRQHYPLPSGVVEYGDKPDVILRGEKSLGIEITNLFLEEGSLPESEQVQRRAREHALSKAQNIYQLNGGGKREFSFGFDKAVPIRNQGELAKTLADLAASVPTPQSGQLLKDAYRHVPELSFAYVTGNEYEDARWRVVQVYDGALMSLERLKEVVEAKEAKSQDYRPCDAYWLLVVVDFIDRAQDQEIRIDGLDTVGTGVFEKILVYKTFFGHVVEAGTATGQPVPASAETDKA